MTPKGTVSTPEGGAAPAGSSRQPVEVEPSSPVIVPIVMFASFIVGTGMILFNYLTAGILGTPSNWYLLGGLGFILVGIVAATQYR